MSKVIAVFGAGTGLGVSVARRFGREGFRVALVARRKDALDTLVGRLADEGIEAAAFPADLTDTAQVSALIGAIRDRFGRIDVVEYGPIGGDQLFTPAKDLDARTLERLSRLFLLTPVEVVRAVLPEMTERGDGAILLSHGGSAVRPAPCMSGLGPVMAAARNYLYSLSGELADTGVYAATLTVNAVIDGSELADFGRKLYAEAADAADADAPTATEIPSVDPDDLAECYWDMYTHRDRVEEARPATPVSQAGGAAGGVPLMNLGLDTAPACTDGVCAR
ncbi:SDR family NAD(P)-dependent oxidoreductase [Streptomyces sp. NPDC059679]|uniref:SDR family NAD(P)-dependent oxidoreductase n=1 Tax=Streptomyces sp. NPDC059679 TaxID=3346903 RepID=UPI003693830C